ncbi:hypothetical protein GCM10010484_58700 [Actinokineospora globicatena]
MADLVGSNTDAIADCATSTAITNAGPRPTSSGTSAAACSTHTPSSTFRRSHRSTSTPVTGLSKTVGNKPATIANAVDPADPVLW